MEWPALLLSLKLALWTMALLIPPALLIGRFLAWRSFQGKSALEAIFALPLVLPPTVLGFYLLLAFGGNSLPGKLYHALFGRQLVFSFDGLLLASLIFNLPFAIQPIQRAFEAIPADVRDAAACCGLTPWRSFWRIELPLAWTGLVSALVMTFAHTLGEFGVVLMVGGNIPGQTKTVAIAIYDRVQAFDNRAAATMSAILLLLSFAAIAFTFFISRRPARWR
jgi:molybdate transport system permease protein